MVPLLQYFEFSYPNGFLFFDSSGQISRRLRDAFAGLVYKNSSVDQREFVLPERKLELFFGIAVSGIQMQSQPKEGFPVLAKSFLGIITEALDVRGLNQFRFRHVLGRPCGDRVQAEELMWKVTGSEIRKELLAGEPRREYQALQSEFVVKNVAFQTRIAILDLVPEREAFEAGEGKAVPHATFALEVRGLLPIVLAEFDSEAFMKNIAENHTREILSKLENLTER